MQEYTQVLQNRSDTDIIYLDTGVPVGTIELIRSGVIRRKELIRDMSTHRYYRTKLETEQNKT